MLRRVNGSGPVCGMNETHPKRALNDALARARTHSPFLRQQLERFPDLARSLKAGDLNSAIEAAAAQSHDPDGEREGAALPAQSRTKLEIMRCLKTYVSREIYACLPGISTAKSAPPDTAQHAA